ncbi:hypothetical protein SASPL_135608 [Salvia splendens]|uniref:Nodulin homeobox N-terminal domain-containing protein n=1 Tax=Salvia splendens TaxID=180675 RepID=A0A8X8WYH4_SALSN|nr:hypothetical protein SASPL_135608 [Salvia splendens]
MTAHRYCRRSIAAGTDSPLRIHSLDSLADSGLRRSGAAPSVPVALSSVWNADVAHTSRRVARLSCHQSIRRISAISAALSISLDCRGLLGLAIMVWEKEKSTFKYLLCGILLLHSMCDLASRVPKIEQISEEQLIDLVFYLLVLLGAYIQVNIHFLIRYCSLQLLTVIVSSQYQEVALALTAYYKVAIQDLVYICKEAAFAAVCVDVKYLRTNDSSRSVSPTTEETLNHLGCSVILLFNFYSLCVSKSYFGNALLTNRFF